MSSLIIVRIVPQSPVSADTFMSYLHSTIGDLQLTAFDLTFNKPIIGDNAGSASYVVPTTPPTTSPLPSPATPAPAQYPSGTTLRHHPAI